jgi:hypothetical protein
MLLRRRMGWSETFALVIAALAFAVGAAAWMAAADQATAALPEYSDSLSFDDRFRTQSPTEPSNGILRSLDRFASVAHEVELREAKGLLSLKLSSQDWRAAVFGDANISEANIDKAKVSEAAIDEARMSEIKSWASADIPLPRPRPSAANVEVPAVSAPAPADMVARQDDRTMWQKMSDLLPGRITLASLTPDGGLFRHGPDLASLGYDGLTAVYDISAKTVYLPDGVSLEAHSGMGSVRDDPEHVDKSNVGATPPAVYELKLREAPFHGVRALRMIPVDGSTLGRSGLLLHSYMLGPNGDSNGCVSIRNYDLFLKAFDNGKVNRLVVVPSLSASLSASQRSTSPS